MNEFRVCRVKCVAAIVMVLATGLAGLSLAKNPTSQPVITGVPTSGVAGLGEVVHFKIERPDAGDGTYRYRLRQGNVTSIKEGPLPAGQATLDLPASLNQPGWLYVDVSAKDPQGGNKMVASAGVVVAPEVFKAAGEVPADFDTFWAEQVKKIKAVPPNPVEKSIPAEQEGVRLFDVTLDSIDGGHVRGQLARPEKGDRFPAIILYQYAGVYPLQKAWATRLAAQGWLVFNVLAHDLPVYEPKAFYEDQASGPLKNYTAIGNLSRDESYFRKMLLRGYQAVEYVTGRPDWDGRVLVARGESQGGLQSIALAALHPKFTAVIVSVPAGANTLDPAAGWPYWHRMEPAESRDAIMQTSRYFDPANFATRVKQPTYVSVGLRDVTATPPAVIAMANRVAGPHELLIMPGAAHSAFHAPSVARVNEWLKSLKTTGKPPADSTASRP